MSELGQELKKIDSDYYVISHRWFTVVYFVFCNLQNTNSQIFSTKTADGNPITDYQQKKKEKERKINSKRFYKHLPRILVGFP